LALQQDRMWHARTAAPRGVNLPLAVHPRSLPLRQIETTD